MTSHLTRFAVVATTAVAAIAVHADEERSLVALSPLKAPTDIAAFPDRRAPLAAGEPAPPLTDMWIYAVGSTHCGWEYALGQAATSCDHGGGVLRVAVLEIGYGNRRLAWMDGESLPASDMYASTAVCVTDGNYSWPCAAGQPIVGWMNEYDVKGREEGVFRYQNTSTNYPNNTVSTGIEVL